MVTGSVVVEQGTGSTVGSGGGINSVSSNGIGVDSGGRSAMARPKWLSKQDSLPLLEDN